MEQSVYIDQKNTKITNQPATSTSQVTPKRKTYEPKNWLYNQLSRYDLN